MTLTLDLILSIVAALVLGGWIGWLARGARIERQSFDAQVEAYQRQIKARQAPKHARTEPRAADAGGARALHAAGGAATGVQRSTDRSPRVGTHLPPARPRIVTSAADIAPVFLPHSDTSRAHIPGTPKLTDTGELHLRAQAFIDKMAADDVEWRAKTGLLT